MRQRPRRTVASLLVLAGAALAFAWQAGRPPAPGPAPAAPQPAATPPPAPLADGLSPVELDDGGRAVASVYTGAVHDPSSLADLREALAERSRLGFSVLEAELAQVPLTSQSTRDDLNAARALYRQAGLLALYAGRPDDATAALGKALELANLLDAPPADLSELRALLGVVALRRGEVDDGLLAHAPAGWSLKFAGGPAPDRRNGARDAVRHFSDDLNDDPTDLRARWLLNLAHLALGDYPAKVPPEHLLPLEPYRSTASAPKFDNVAAAAGLHARGPTPGGAALFDDFDNDGRPDLLIAPLGPDLGASLALNQGDGTFLDKGPAANLADQVHVRHAAAADFDNDGHLDLVLLRGETGFPMRPSLLRNRGAGAFEDVTLAAGLALPITAPSACWADYDNDGLADLFIPSAFDATALPRPGHGDRPRLYHNEGHGTFRDLAAAAGIHNEANAQGAAWGDYDLDGRPDLLIANRDAPPRLYHNEGDGTFHDAAPALNLNGPERAASCAFADFDNDGRPDLLINDAGLSLAELIGHDLDRPAVRPSRPFLYRNLGTEGFREIGRDLGLDRPLTPLGCTLADLDNDGTLDLYYGTGGDAVSFLVPNRMYRNVNGRKFEDITVPTETGHLQKAHAVACADLDNDGDLDLFVMAGGATPGDDALPLLFRNPTTGNASLRVKLTGTRTNRSALGARLKATIAGPQGGTHAVHRTVGAATSAGGNTLAVTIGLGPAKQVSRLEIWWPATNTTQTLRDLAANQAIEIIEGTAGFRPLIPPDPAPTPAP